MGEGENLFCEQKSYLTLWQPQGVAPPTIALRLLGGKARNSLIALLSVCLSCFAAKANAHLRWAPIGQLTAPQSAAYSLFRSLVDFVNKLGAFLLKQKGPPPNPLPLSKKNFLFLYPKVVNPYFSRRQ